MKMSITMKTAILHFKNIWEMLLWYQMSVCLKRLTKVNGK